MNHADPKLLQKAQTPNIFTPLTGGTVTIPNTKGDQVIIINPATDIASLTIAWPTAYDGQIIRIVSTRNISSISHTGGSLNRSINTMMAGGNMNYIYDATNSTFMCDGEVTSNITCRAYNGKLTAGGAGNVVFYATDSGLVGGNATFASIIAVIPMFDVANPNDSWNKSVITNSNKTITTNCKRNTFNGITLSLGILGTYNVIENVSLNNVPDGVALSFLVFGVLA